MQSIMSPEKLQQLMMTMGVLFWVILVVAILISMAIAVVICWFLSSCLERVPAEHRKQQPAMVWLLLIPCFAIVWNFFVYPKIAESYKSYFDSMGRTDVGDCGRNLGLWYSILGCVSLVLGIIPFVNFVNCLLSPATLVLWIIFLIKAGTLKSQIPVAAA